MIEYPKEEQKILDEYFNTAVNLSFVYKCKKKREK